LSEEKLFLEKFEKEQSHFDAHYEEFLEKYEDMVLAIKDRKVIDADKNLEKLLERLEKKGIDIRLVYITSIPKKGIAFIL
jgi:thymidylate kinase